MFFKGPSVPYSSIYGSRYSGLRLSLAGGKLSLTDVQMKTILLRTLKLLLVGYVLICVVLYFLQEKLIFFPQKLSKDYHFSFDQPFEELFITTHDGKQLNGLLFKAKVSKGLIFYRHGNAGALNSWGEVASTYTDLGYDVFLLDYRGYGKSEGRITGQQQLMEDMQTAYNEMKKRYPEDRITVLGYSLGTGPATWLASQNGPKRLILQAPYYSLTDMMRHYYRLLPTFILKYPLRTYDYIQRCSMPVVLFHGDGDGVIYYGSSLKLREVLKPTDTLITLKGWGHNAMSDSPQYRDAIRKLLNP